MTYNPYLCDLIIASSGNDIYRLSLDEGKFLSPFISASDELLSIHYYKHLNTVLSGGL